MNKALLFLCLSQVLKNIQCNVNAYVSFDVFVYNFGISFLIRVLCGNILC